GDLLHAVHLPDLGPHLVLVFADVAVRVDLLGPQVVHDLDRALPEYVELEDVRQARLWIDAEDQHPLALLGEPVAGRRREGRLPEPALAAEHHVAALWVLAEELR